MKKIVTLSALSLGILFLAGCGQWPVSQTQPTAPATPPTDKTVLWQTYKNDKHGYEIKFPKDWVAFWSQWTPGGPAYHIEDINQRDNIVFASKYPNDYSQDLDNYEWINIELQNGEFFTKNSTTVDDFWNKLGKKDEATEEIINKFVEKKTISGVDFIFFEQYNWSIKDQKKIWTPQALFMNKGEFFWVKGNGENLFDLILSTFKFTK